MHIKKKKQSKHNTKDNVKSQKDKRGREGDPQKQFKTTTEINILIITFNINGLNAPTKRHRLNGLKNKARIYAVYNRPSSDLGTHTDPEVRGQKVFHANANQKKPRTAILTADKTDTKIKNVTREKGH